MTEAKLTWSIWQALWKKSGTYRFLYRLHGLRANKALCPPLFFPASRVRTTDPARADSRDGRTSIPMSSSRPSSAEGRSTNAQTRRRFP